MFYLRRLYRVREPLTQLIRLNQTNLPAVVGRSAIRVSTGSRYQGSSRPLPSPFATRNFAMVHTDDITARLSALSLSPTAKCAHPAVSNPTEWKDVLGKTPGVPESFELCKTLVFKPKTAKSATPVPVIVIARDETETSSGALGKKLNLKDLRLAADDLLKEFFAMDKDSLSPLAITKDNFARVQVILDSTIATATVPLALHASSSDATIFLSGPDVVSYLTSLETADTKLHVVDFAALRAEAVASPSGVGPVTANAAPRRAEDAKIEGAAQIAVGIKKELDFPGWYTSVLIKAEMIDYYSVSGCYILKPWSYSIWERIQEWFDGQIKELDVENSYFPMFVSSKVLEREKDHIEGFAPEVAWVTRAGNTDLEEPIAIRPTSETVMYPYYAKWIQSHRDLPLKLNQWNSVVRWEFKNPQPFLRTREFLWQEGHTAHLARAEADTEVRDILDLYRRVYEELLAVPVVPGIKSEKEKFAGGLYTTTVEGFVPTSGRGIQGATSHCLGQNFSRMFGISVEDPSLSTADKAKILAEPEKYPDAGKAFVWQNSWGLSTRTIGVMVMVHGDNQGLVLPPRVANVQVVVVPVGVTAKTSDDMREKIANACTDVVKTLKKEGVRAKADLREGYTPGWKFNDWEQKGVPIRLEIGPLDLEKSSTLSVRRDTSAKAPIPLSSIATSVPELLTQIQSDMFNRAKKTYDSRLTVVRSWSNFTPTLEKKCVVVMPWCEEEKCEDEIKEKSAKESLEQADEKAPSAGAKSLAIPFDQERWGKIEEGEKCVGCGKPAKRWTMFGRSY